MTHTRRKHCFHSVIFWFLQSGVRCVALLVLSYETGGVDSLLLLSDQTQTLINLCVILLTQSAHAIIHRLNSSDINICVTSCARLTHPQLHHSLLPLWCSDMEEASSLWALATSFYPVTLFLCEFNGVNFVFIIFLREFMCHWEVLKECIGEFFGICGM